MKSNRYRRQGRRHREDNNQFFADKDGQTTNHDSQSAFFQPKLEIDPVDSPSEKEADAAANKVVNQPHSEGNGAQTVQRKKIQRQGKEEEPKAKRIQRQDKEEQPAAKRIQKQEKEEPKAKLIQRMGKEEEPQARLIQRQGKEEEPKAKLIQRQGKEEEPQAKLIQKQSLPEDEVQQKTKGGSTNNKLGMKEEEGQAMLEDKIKKTKGQGVPLPEEVRLEMENEFGVNFDKVRIHTGAEALEMTQMLHAHAFTHGYDIYFNEGRFDPESKDGKELLAHELAHVVQQKGNG